MGKKLFVQQINSDRKFADYDKILHNSIFSQMWPESASLQLIFWNNRLYFHILEHD